MPVVEDFLTEIDRRWRPAAAGKVRLHVIGAAALLLRTTYQGVTKDSDVLETAEITRDTRQQLLELAGEGTELHTRHKMYLEIVANGLPLLPHVPLYHPLDRLNATLQHFEIHVLDVVDVVVSKLKPFRPKDLGDIKVMIALGLVPHDRLIERFRDAIDDFAGGAYGEEIPKYVRNLNRIERDLLDVPETSIELPDWLAARC